MCDYERIYQAVENKKYLFKAANPIQNALGRVAVVSDCAHALGASRHWKMAGEISDFASYSYHAVNLTADQVQTLYIDFASIMRHNI